MANEIWHHFTTGLTLYARIRRRTDLQVYDVDAGGNNFEAWADASVTTYDLPLTDEDGSFYVVDFPSGISAGVYDVGIFLQSGGDPVIGDAAVAEGVMYWDGSAEINARTLDTLINDDVIGADDDTMEVLSAEHDQIIQNQQIVLNRYPTET